MKKQTEAPELQQEHKTKKKNTKLFAAAVIVLVYVIIMCVVAVVADGRHVRFYLSGSAEMTVEAGTQWQEPGIRAVSAGRLFGEGTTPIHVDASGAPDMSKPGDYTVHYSSRLGFTTYTAQRLVHVRDTTPPVIELNRVEGYIPDWSTGYTEEGYTATDNVDGNISDRVQRTEYDDRIVYFVSDSSGNCTQAERKLEFSDLRPQIVLNGDSEENVPASTEPYIDPGFAAYDGFGNDISDQVQVDGYVNRYAAGTYTLTYTITGVNGNQVQAVRRVNVTPINHPETVSPDGCVIYLTFDDGPGPYTAELLDVLEVYRVPVTFFVTGTDPEYYDMIGRAYEEGHSIGVHTYSHSYKQIYSSEDAFFEDFNYMQEIIYAQTGSYTDICRFPGGSSNTVSNFNPGIMTRLAAALTDMGYVYFDWNVASGDAGETTSTDKVVDNVIKGCSSHRISVVLQHDIKGFSVAAVEDIIIWGLNNGYTFLALDPTSPTAHHSISN